MKKRGKRVLACALIVILSACTACGGKGSSSKSSDVKAKKVDMNTVFQAKSVSLGDDLGENSYFSCMNVVDGRYNMVIRDWTDDTDGGTVYSFAQDGTDIKKTKLPDLDDGVSVSGTAMDIKGNIYRVLDASTYDDDGNYQAGKMTLEQISPDGTAGWSADLYTPKGSDDEENFSVSSLVTDSSGDNLYVAESDAKKIDVFSTADGSKTGSCAVSDDQTYGTLAADGNGDIVYSYDGFYKVNLKKGELEKLSTDNDDLGYGTIYSGSGNMIYADDSDGISSIDVSTGKISLLIDYVASDLDIDNLQHFAGTDESHFAAVYDDDDGNDAVMVLTKADPDIYNNKTVVTLGYTSLDDSIRKQVIAFNQNSEKYRVNLTLYSSDSDDDAYGDTLNKILLSGNMPDMLLLSGGEEYTSYANKGVFEPLDSYFGENGPSSDEYMTNIFDAFRVGGKMYILPTSFSMICLAGRQSDFGDVTGITFDQLRQAAKKRGIKVGASMGSFQTKDMFLMQAMMMTLDEYVDFESGKCSFDSDQFKELLAFANEFPDEMSDDTDDSQDGLRSNKQVVMEQYVSSFNTYNEILSGYVGEPTAFMGFPGSGKSGPVITTETELVMSASSKNKDACWEFMKSAIGEDGPSSGYQDAFPVNIKRLEKLKQKEMEPQYYIDENGKRQVIDQSISIGDQEIKINPLTQEQADAFEDLLKSLHTVVYYDVSQNSINSIVSEEAGAYFQGQKSADDVADTIQRRVNIYINENK